MDQRAEFDEELEEAWPEEDGLPQNAAEYQRQESVRHLRKENETLRRELKAAQRIQLAALALLLIGVVCAYLAGHYFGRKDGISSGYDAGFYNGQQQTDAPAAVQTEPETESARPAMSEARTAASTPRAERRRVHRQQQKQDLSPRRLLVFAQGVEPRLFCDRRRGGTERLSALRALRPDGLRPKFRRKPCIFPFVPSARRTGRRF